MVTKNYKYKKPANLPLDKILDVTYIKKEVYKADIFYIIKKCNKVFVNFLSLESRYKKYKITLFLNLYYINTLSQAVPNKTK